MHCTCTVVSTTAYGLLVNVRGWARYWPLPARHSRSAFCSALSSALMSAVSSPSRVASLWKGWRFPADIGSSLSPVLGADLFVFLGAIGGCLRGEGL